MGHNQDLISYAISQAENAQPPTLLSVQVVETHPRQFLATRRYSFPILALEGASALAWDTTGVVVSRDGRTVTLVNVNTGATVHELATEIADPDNEMPEWITDYYNGNVRGELVR